MAGGPADAAALRDIVSVDADEGDLIRVLGEVRVGGGGGGGGNARAGRGAPKGVGVGGDILRTKQGGLGGVCKGGRKGLSQGGVGVGGREGGGYCALGGGVEGGEIHTFQRMNI